MLNQVENGQWRVGGVTVELWQTVPDLYKNWSEKLLEVQVFALQNAWLVLDEGPHEGGLVAHIVDGNLDQTWRFNKGRIDYTGMPAMVLDSALEMFHYHECRGRQYGCGCSND